MNGKNDVTQVTVTKNNGEAAEFSDGSSVSRQRIGLNPEFAKVFGGIIPVQAFKLVFKEGITISEAKRRLADPRWRSGVDGTAVGDTSPASQKIRGTGFGHK